MRQCMKSCLMCLRHATGKVYEDVAQAAASGCASLTDDTLPFTKISRASTFHSEFIATSPKAVSEKSPKRGAHLVCQIFTARMQAPAVVRLVGHMKRL